MSDSPRAFVSRELHAAALSDAINWQDTVLEAHWRRPDGTHHMHCSPAAPCEEAAKADALVRRYRIAKAGLKP